MGLTGKTKEGLVDDETLNIIFEGLKYIIPELQEEWAEFVILNRKNNTISADSFRLFFDLRDKYPTKDSFSGASLLDSVSKEDKEKWNIYRKRELATIYINFVDSGATYARKLGCGRRKSYSEKDNLDEFINEIGGLAYVEKESGHPWTETEILLEKIKYRNKKKRKSNQSISKKDAIIGEGLYKGIALHYMNAWAEYVKQEHNNISPIVFQTFFKILDNYNEKKYYTMYEEHEFSNWGEKEKGQFLTMMVYSRYASKVVKDYSQYLDQKDPTRKMLSDFYTLSSLYSENLEKAKANFYLTDEQEIEKRRAEEEKRRIKMIIPYILSDEFKKEFKAKNGNTQGDTSQEVMEL